MARSEGSWLATWLVRQFNRPRIHRTAVTEEPYRWLPGRGVQRRFEYERTFFGAGVEIGPQCVIGRGVHLGEGVVIDSQCFIGPNAIIGRDTRVTHRAWIGPRATIGERCLVGGFVTERTYVGDDCTVLGDVLGASASAGALDACEDAEQPPSILDGSSVGPGARVIGDVTVGPNAMVAAGATVTMDVPGSHVATGVDTMLCVEEWLATFAELEPSLDEVQA